VITLAEFSKTLSDLKPGQGARLNYEAYELLFPPGEPDDDARGRAFRFAREHGCRIDNRPNERAIWFYKNAHRT